LVDTSEERIFIMGANVGSSLLNKDVVAKLAINTGRPVEIVARELGSDERTLDNRVKAYRSMHRPVLKS